MSKDKKEIEELKDYEEKEKEIVANKISKLNGKQASILDFYPAMNGEHPLFKLKQPYTRCGAPYVKVQDLLPFFETQIVFIRPIGKPYADQYKNEQNFKKYYGVSVEQLIELAKKHKVAINLSYFPTKYAGLEYLRPILEKRPPTIIRSLEFTRFINPRFDEYLVEGEDIFQRLNKRIPRYKTGIPKDYMVEMSALTYAEFKSMAHPEFVNEISPTRTNVDFAAVVADLYFIFYNAPIYQSLEGEHVIYSRELLAYNWKGLRNEINNLTRQGKTWIFPAELAKILVDNLKMVKIGSYENAIDYFKDYKKAREALVELDKMLEVEAYKRYGEDYIDVLRYKADEARAVFEEVRGTVDTTIRGIRDIRRSLAIGWSILGAFFLPLPFNRFTSLLGLLNLPYVDRCLTWVDYKIARLKLEKLAYIFFLELDGVRALRA